VPVLARPKLHQPPPTYAPPSDERMRAMFAKRPQVGAVPCGHHGGAVVNARDGLPLDGVARLVSVACLTCWRVMQVTSADEETLAMLRAQLERGWPEPDRAGDADLCRDALAILATSSDRK
jgi:hypothetical protein